VSDKGYSSHCTPKNLDQKLKKHNLSSELQSPILVDKMGSMQQDSHFKKIQNFKADYADATFTQYESQRTGLRVVVVDRKGPKVYGNFAVATEIHDDSGSRKLYETL
jgi:hypothetical protein